MLGNGDNGELGHNETNANADKSTPTQVFGLTSRVTQISTGRRATCALVNAGVMCWGSGLLGNSAASTALAPQQVISLTSGVTQISAGEDHTCVMVSDGAKCWGTGGNGRLGHNEFNANADKSTPTQVFGLTSEVKQISAGAFHTCAVVDGAALCWGNGGNGRLGHNETGNENAHKSRPTQVFGLTTGVTQISAGSEHTCAVVDGGAWCWGLGNLGKLGNGSNSDATAPQQVDGLTTGVKQLLTGEGNLFLRWVGMQSSQEGEQREF